MGDLDVQYVWRFLRCHKIDLVVRKSWCESNDPNFRPKLLMLLASISPRPRRPLCYPWTKAFDPGFGASAGLSVSYPIVEEAGFFFGA